MVKIIALLLAPVFAVLAMVAGEAAESAPGGKDRMKELEERVQKLEQELARMNREPAAPPAAKQERADDPFGFNRERFGRDAQDLMDKLRREMERSWGSFENFGSSWGNEWFNSRGEPREPLATQRPRLGVELAPVSDELKERFKNNVEKGAFVMSVVPGSAAELGGVKVGDAVTSFDGKAVAEPKDLIEQIRNTPEGKKELVVSRRGESVALAVDLGKAEPADVEAPTAEAAPKARGWWRRGDTDPVQQPGSRQTLRTEVKASALELNDALAKELNLSDEQRTKMSQVLANEAKTLNEEVAKSSGQGHGRRGYSFNFGGNMSELVEKRVKNAEKELAGVLSPEQLKNWGSWREKNSSVSLSHSMTIEQSGTDNAAPKTGTGSKTNLGF